MIASLALPLALALAAGDPALPEGRARYRVEIAGASVGFAELSIACAHETARCRLGWESRLRSPEGGVQVRRVGAPIDGSGVLAGELEVESEGAGLRRRSAPGHVPLSVAEVVLSARPGRCIDVVDEESGRLGTACAREDGHALRVEALGTVERVHRGSDGFPQVVELSALRVRYVRDAAAAVPDAVSLEIRVPGPPASRGPRRFCGLAPDAPPARGSLAALPAPRPDGRSCREQAKAYAAEVRARGLPSRIAVGVAHDGAGFVWHAWVEAGTDAGWVAVDPAFGQLPARGPRFTVARHGGDPAGEAEAGRRILACWGRAPVE